MYSFRKAAALKTCFHKTESLKKAIKENNPQFEPCENCIYTLLTAVPFKSKINIIIIINHKKIKLDEKFIKYG